ncbi:MAG: ketosynthase chain-length factor [Terriglobales bacterium]
MSRRAVITGIGVVAPNGIGTEEYWSATCQGRNAIRPITHFDPSRYATHLAGEVDGFKAEDYIDGRLIVQTDRWTWMALAAADMALKDAQLDPKSVEPYQMSVITASSSGGNEFGQREIGNLWGKGVLYVGAYQSIAWFYAATTGQIAIKWGMKGPCGVVVSEGTGGLEALAQSRRTIQRGVDVVVSGGTEAPLCPYALVCQLQNGLLSKQSDPAMAYRPFDAKANGHVPGEGGAILLVEDLEHAQKRGAPHIYAEILGYCATQDGYHYAKPAPEAQQYARAMQQAIQKAGITPHDIDVIFADGAGTLEGDALEAEAIRKVFNSRASKVPITVPKSMVGRLYAGGAPLDVAAAALSMRDQVVPPTINLTEPAKGCEFNFVRQQQKMPVRTVLVNGRGYGGFNSSLVLRKYAA